MNRPPNATGPARRITPADRPAPRNADGTPRAAGTGRPPSRAGSPGPQRRPANLRPVVAPPRPTAKADDPDAVRLSKRVMEVADCSRAEAERLIESGRVRVDGTVQQLVPTRVRPTQNVSVDGQQPAKGVAPATLLMHKPAGVPMETLLTLIDDTHHQPNDRSGQTLLARHTKGLQCATPLEPAASGLVVWTQVPGIARKLVDEGSLVEHELMVDVAGPVSSGQLAELNRSVVVDGRAMLPARVSISQTQPDLTRLRIAMKGYWLGQVLQLCDAAGLRLLAIKRLRIGRLPLRDLPAGQWRFLLGYERF